MDKLKWNMFLKNFEEKQKKQEKVNYNYSSTRIIAKMSVYFECVFELTMLMKPASRDAPPTRKPSTSG